MWTIVGQKEGHKSWECTEANGDQQQRNGGNRSGQFFIWKDATWTRCFIQVVLAVVLVVVSIVVKMVTSHSTVPNRRKVDPRLGSAVVVELVVVVSNVLFRATVTTARTQVKEATKRSNSTTISVGREQCQKKNFSIVLVFLSVHFSRSFSRIPLLLLVFCC